MILRDTGIYLYGDNYNDGLLFSYNTVSKISFSDEEYAEDYDNLYKEITECINKTYNSVSVMTTVFNNIIKSNAENRNIEKFLFKKVKDNRGGYYIIEFNDIPGEFKYKPIKYNIKIDNRDFLKYYTYPVTGFTEGNFYSKHTKEVLWYNEKENYFKFVNPIIYNNIKDYPEFTDMFKIKLNAIIFAA